MFGVNDLVLYIDNDGDLYRTVTVPLRRSLMQRRAQGNYDPDRAVDAYMSLVEAGARKYVREFDVRTPWGKAFPLSVREEAARDLARRFENEASLGNYDYLISEPTDDSSRSRSSGKSRAELERDIAKFAKSRSSKRRSVERPG